MSEWDLEVDFISVGAGIGGLTAAIVAHDAGQDVLVLEKSELVGGVAAYSYGQVWCSASHLEAEAGIEDSFEKSREYLQFMTKGRSVRDNLETLLTTTPVVIRYLQEKAGVRFNVIRQFADYYFPHGPGSLWEGRFLEVEPIPGKALGDWQSRTRVSPHVPPGITQAEITAWGGPSSIRTWDFDVIAQRSADDARSLGPGLAAYLVKAALVDRGVTCYTSTPAKRLVISDTGEVCGVIAERDGRELRIHARRGVLLATSGYDGNTNLIAKFERIPSEEWHTAVFPGIDGDGMVMGTEAGAQVAVAPVDMMLPGFHVPGEEHEGVPMYRFANGELSYGIAVNMQGRRFADEAFYKSFMQSVLEFDASNQDYRNFPCFLIFDQAARDIFALGSIMPGESVPGELAVQSDTVRGLAEALGIDPDGFEDTVNRYNEDCAAGHDRDFGRGELPWSRQMWGDLGIPSSGAAIRPLNKPPYYGVRLTFVGVGQNNGGLLTDADGRVVHARGHAIPGLYAAGNAAAYVELDRGYQSGMANARGMTFGYLAAKHAATRSAEQPTEMTPASAGA